MSEAKLSCRRCGDLVRTGARQCSRCGTRVAAEDLPPSLFLDTIHFPGMADADDERRVRPALAVLFRVAVGPQADYYAPRFLRYEKSGRGAPGWHWPSFWLPSVWAFYRKLWLAGILFALLPVAGAFAFLALATRIDHASVPWLLGAAVLIWLLPGIIPALIANSLLYRRVRRIVQRAEASTGSAAQVASLLARRNPVSLVAALTLGGGALLLAANLVAPGVRVAWFEHEVRTQLAAALASVRPMQRADRGQLGAIPRHSAQDRRERAAYAGRGGIFRRGELPSGQRAAAPGAGAVVSRVVRPLHPAGAGGRFAAADPVAVHPGRHSREVPAQGMQQGLTAYCLRHTLASHGCRSRGSPSGR